MVRGAQLVRSKGVFWLASRSGRRGEWQQAGKLLAHVFTLIMKRQQPAALLILAPISA